MKFIPLAEIKHLLPDNYLSNKNTAALSIIYYEGHQQWDTPLDLSHFYTEELPSGHTPLVLINGNLTVSQLYNSNTEKTVNLLVLGNLHTANAILSGQHIHVRRNLYVDQVFWGDQDCGSLTVGGHITARLFINTDYGVDDYRFSMRQGMLIDFLLNHDLERDVAEPTVLFHLLQPEYLNERTALDESLYSWKDWLNKTAIINAIALNQSIMLDTPNPDYADPIYPSPFSSKKLNVDNLTKLSSGTTFNQDKIAKGEDIHIEFRDAEMRKQIHFVNGDPNTTTLYFQYREDYAMRLMLKKSKSLLPFTKGYVVDSSYCYPSDKEPTWQPMVNTSIADALTKEWEALLDHYPQMIGIAAKRRAIITVDNFMAIMNQPLVERLGRRYYESQDAAIFYCGQQWHFRSEDKEAKQAARITILNYLGKNQKGTLEYEYFHYELEKDAKGIPFIQIYYQLDHGPEADIYILEAANRQRMLKAINYFIYVQKHIERLAHESIEKELTEEEKKLQQAKETGAAYLKTILSRYGKHPNHFE